MNALEDLTNPAVERRYVEQRVDEWVDRLSTLYDHVVDWLPAGWTATRTDTMPMQEELMRRLDVGPRRQPVLTLLHDGSARGHLEPRGLWIIGANGRVDLHSPGGHYLIVDRSEAFDPPDWQIASILTRREQRSFDRESLRDALA